MDVQKFLQDKLAALGVMAAPIPPAAKMVLNLKGSTPQNNKNSHQGPLFKVGLDGFEMRDDSKIHYDNELGYYGPGKLN